MGFYNIFNGVNSGGLCIGRMKRIIFILIMLIAFSSFTTATVEQSDVIFAWEGDNDFTPTKGAWTLTNTGGNVVFSSAEKKLGTHSFDLRTDKSYMKTNWVDYDLAHTIDMWIYIDAWTGTNYAILWSTDSANPTSMQDYSLAVELGAEHFQWDLADNIAITLELGVWHHVLVSYDGADTTLYLNGTSQGTFPDDPNSNQEMMFGVFANNYDVREFDGYMDSIKIIDRAITSTEATQLYNSNNGVTYDDLFIPPVNNNISISLYYPINGTTYFGDFNGSIVVNLTNVNGSANCNINNDTRWTVQGSNFGNETVLFYNNTPIIETNVSIQIDCYDSSSYNNYTGLWFSKYNILNVSIYNDITGDLINSTVDMALYNPTYYNSSYSTDNGSIYIIGLTNGTYTAEFSSDNYSNREYSVTLGFGETTQLKAYLSVIDGNVIFTARDRGTGAVIQGATITVKKYIDGILTTIYVKETDITGRIQFGYGEGVEYYFTVTKTGYEDKTFTLDPIIFTEYSVYMDSTAEIEDTTDLAGVSILHSPKLFYEGLNNLSVTISNTDGALTSYGVNVSYLNNKTSYTGTNAYGSSFDESFNINGSTWGDMLYLTIYYTLNGGNEKVFSYNYEIVPEPSNNTILYNQDKTYGLGEFERVSIFTLITLIVGGFVSLFAGVIAGLGSGLLIMGYFVVTGFISLWYVLIPLFAGSIILIWRSSQ